MKIRAFRDQLNFLSSAPVLIFSQILLVDRLDHDPKEESGRLPFTVIAIPLWISLVAWLTFSFGATDANPCSFRLDSASRQNNRARALSASQGGSVYARICVRSCSVNVRTSRSTSTINSSSHLVRHQLDLPITGRSR